MSAFMSKMGRSKSKTKGLICTRSKTRF